MMNQPTEDNIRQIKERQVEFEKRLIDMERYISPIKFMQLEIDSGRIFRRIDEIQKNTNITKIQTEGVSGDLLQIRESQVDIRDRLVEHGQRIESIEQKQDTHTEILDQLMGFGERIEATMATKDDIKIMATKDDIGRLETRIGQIETTQAEQGNKLDQILALLKRNRQRGE
jgi:hypothetical protein